MKCASLALHAKRRLSLLASPLIVAALLLVSTLAPAYAETIPREPRIGELLIVPLDVQITATNGNDKSPAGFHFVRFTVLVKNVGNNSICTHLTATLESDLGVGRRDGTWTLKTNSREEIAKGPDIHQLLPGEILNGSVVFADLRNGVKPLTLTVASEGQTCAMKSPPPTGNPLLFAINKSESGRKVSLVFVGNEFVNSDTGTANRGAFEGANVKSDAPVAADNNQGGFGGGAFHVGNGVSAPRALETPDPEYSEEARKAKYQGVVVLWLIVGPDGKPHDIRVSRPLGMGLDQKAIEAVNRWRFEPAMKDGRPVPVQINVEVNFRFYQPDTKLSQFPGVDRMTYPFDVVVLASRTQYQPTWIMAEMAIQIWDGTARKGYTIGCLGTEHCAHLMAGTYPGRWHKGKLEIVTSRPDGSKMQKWEYAIVAENCETPFTCK